MIKGLAAFVSSQYWMLTTLDPVMMESQETGDRGGLVMIMRRWVLVVARDNDHFRRLLDTGQGRQWPDGRQ